MNSDDADWSSLNLGDGDDSLTSFQKQDESSMGSLKIEQTFDDSTQGDDEFANTLGLYDGYDSYNESGMSSDDNLENLLEEDLFDHDDSGSKYKFMNNKDGMATCERCGSVGVKHAFYSKTKRFCSLSCSRSYATQQREGKPLSHLPAILPVAKKGKPGAKKITQKTQQQTLFKASYRDESTHIFDWGPYLTSASASAASVSCFKHVPMHDCWEQMGEGILVEVPNTDLDLPKDIKVYWIATILKIYGYKVLLRYEGFGSDGSKDFWSNLLSEDVHNVGWCATYGKMLAPPKTIKEKYINWKEFLIKRLTGTRTIPPHFSAKAQEWLSNHKLSVGMRVEVVNKMCVSAMRVAVIKEVIGCRLRLNYLDSKEENDEFWCHMASPLIHPIGWAQTVGHKLHASHEYIRSCLNKMTLQKFNPDDATSDMFPEVRIPPHGLCFQVGMKLEAIDPLNLSAICVATVTKVLGNNYMMIGIDGSMAENGSDWFCYHATSPCIFPVGFCEINHLELTPPRGTKGLFKWFDYLKQTKSMAAPVKLFDKEIPKHGFRPGMKVEAVDLMEPRLICVATVTKIVGRLLRIHFDGWENNYDQWIDCQSPDIFPVGWCQVMKHGLEGPRNRLEASMPSQGVPVSNARKRKGKGQVYRGPKKKKNGGQDKRLREITPKQSITSLVALEKSISSSYPSLSQDPASNSAFPPHKILSPETVAATLPPLLEPDITGNSIKGFKDLEVSGSSSNSNPSAKPPILSPHRKIPQGFSLELAERLKASTSLSSVSNSLNSSGSSILEKSFKPGVVPPSQMASNTTAMDRSSMESKSNLIASTNDSATLDNSSLKDESGSTSGVIVLTLSSRLRALHLSKWSLSDVVDVLKVNGCTAYTSLFIKKNIDGASLMTMSTDRLTKLVSVVDGPIMRLCDLIQQVKSCAAATDKMS